MIRWRGWYHLVDFTDDSSCLTCMFLLVTRCNTDVNRGICLRILEGLNIHTYNIEIKTTTLWWYDDEADTTWWTSLMTVPVWRVCFYWCNIDVNRGICLRILLLLNFHVVQYWNKNDNSVMIWGRGWYHLVDFTDDSSCLTCMFFLVTRCNTDVNRGICLRILEGLNIHTYNIEIRTTTLWWYDDEADITCWTSLMTVPVWRVCFYWSPGVTLMSTEAFVWEFYMS